MNRYGFSQRQFGRGLLGAGLIGLPGLVFFDDDEDPTGGGAPRQRENAGDIAARYSGDVVRMAADLAEFKTDNFKLREDKRKLNETITTLKGQVPVEGAVILTAEDARAWEAYQALGKPEEVKTSIESGKAAIEAQSKAARETLLAEAAKEAGLKPALLKIVAKDLDIQMREVEVAGEDGQTTKAKRPVVVTKNGEVVAEKPLRDYFKEQGDDVLLSLEAGESDGQQQYQQPTTQPGVTYPAQGAGAPAGKTNFASLSVNRYAHNVPKAAESK